MSNDDNFMNKMNPAKNYSSEIYAKTKKYQKIYSKYKLPNNENIFKDKNYFSVINIKHGINY